MDESSDVELVIERLVAGGDALAREAGGRVVFVAGALPGDRVRARLRRSRRDVAFYDVVEVLTPGPDRVEAPCPFVAAGCGGCGWQHLTLDAQRVAKVAIVAESLARIGRHRDAEVVSGPVLDPWGFRTTVRLAIEQGRPGFRAGSSHDVVPVDACLVAHPRLADLLATARFPGATDVTLRCGDATGERSALVDPSAATRSARLPADVARGDQAAIHEVVAGQRFRVSTGSFFQTRRDGAEALVAVVAAAVGDRPPRVLIDAYGGVGLFAATIPAGRVVVVEASASSCADAEDNLAGRAATIVRSEVGRWRPVPADVVVADPARSGLGRPGVGALAATGCRRLVLVSCDPVSLSRDTALLAEAGYAHRRSVVVDLFPHTPHVEVVTTFDREN